MEFRKGNRRSFKVLFDKYLRVLLVPGLGLDINVNKSVPLNGSGGGNGAEKWHVSEAGTLARNKRVMLIAKSCYQGVF